MVLNSEHETETEFLTDVDTNVEIEDNISEAEWEIF